MAIRQVTSPILPGGKSFEPIAGLPFRRQQGADTLCHSVATASLQREYAHLSATESQYADFFGKRLTTTLRPMNAQGALEAYPPR